MGTDGGSASARLLLEQATTLNLQTGNLLNWGRLRKKCPASPAEEVRTGRCVPGPPARRDSPALSCAERASRRRPRGQGGPSRPEAKKHPVSSGSPEPPPASVRGSGLLTRGWAARRP